MSEAPETKEFTFENRYLGDGVYASFDGYQIWLAANHHENRVVALEPNVFGALIEYKDDLIKALRAFNSNREEKQS